MTIEVDLSEALQEIDDDALLEEVEERKLSLGRDFDPMDDLRDARNEILRGRYAEALVILDRLILPKWTSKQGCELDYKRAQQS